MQLYSNIWTIIESCGFFIVILIFFLDPIRRWNFFGYRPTAVMGMFDPKTGKVLLAKINGAWSFSQGGMYQNNIYITVINILKRELGIPENYCKLMYTIPLGTLRIKNKNLTRRARISTFSIASNLRGKGYLGCFLRSKLDELQEVLHKGTGVIDIKICSIVEARELVSKYTIGEHQPLKQKMILRMLDEIEVFASRIQSWETSQLDQEEIQEKLEKESSGKTDKSS